MQNALRPIHPGEILREEYLLPLGMSASMLAKVLHVPANRIRGIVNEKRGITADTALRLSRYFRTSAELWLNLQKRYELRLAGIEIGAKIRREVKPAA